MQTQKQKQLIGAIAVILLLTITTLALVNRWNFIVWVVLDLIVAGVANLLLKRLNRKPI
jgi:hypothetical protein